MAADLSKEKQFWKIAENEWSNWKTRARKAYRYYRGQQWDEADLQKLRLEGRPALTLNKIKPIIRNLSGWQRQNRQELKVLPRKRGIEKLAELYTEILKYFYDVSLADWQISEMFVDGIICGKGFIAVDIDYQKDPLNGELVLMRQNPLMVFEDPYSQRYDLSDATFIFRTYWMDKHELETNFPKAKKDLGVLEKVPAIERQRIGRETDDYTEVPRQDANDIDKWRYLVKECWWKEYVNKKFLADKVTSDVLEFEGAELEKKVDKIVSLRPDRFRKIELAMPVLHLTTYVGDLVLQTMEDPFDGITMFPIVRFCADRINADENYFKGEVEDLIDAQNEHNKRRSQALHHLNTAANSGWQIERGALLPGTEKDVEKKSSKSGYIMWLMDGGLNKVRRIEPTRLSDGHIALEKLSEDDLKKISGVNADLLGYAPEKQESGIAMQLRQQRGLITTEPVYDNFQYTQRLLGELLLEFIRKTDVLSNDEIEAIASERKFAPEGVDIKSLLRDRRTGKYSVVLTTKQNSPTARLSNFYAMLEAIKAGIQIPQEMVIEASDFPFKEELLSRMKQAQQREQMGWPRGNVILPPGV